jgi:adenine-specific DNA-methyltransferase
MDRKQKLELTWIGKYDEIKVEPRILLEDKSKGYGDPNTENMLIHGDNLLALKALEQDFAGKIKCIYIDPPFNTGAAFEHYDDNLEHSIWLDLLARRLKILHALLCEEGCIFVNLDDSESAYAKVLLDEIFGRINYINEIIVATNKPFGYKSTSNNLFKQANHILFYAKDKSKFILNTDAIFVEKSYDPQYKWVFCNTDKEEKDWTWRNIRDIVAEKLGYSTATEAKRELKEEFEQEIALFAIENADKVFRTASVTGGALIKRRNTINASKKNKNMILRHPNDDMDYMFIGGERVIFYKDRLKLIDGQLLPGELITDIWNDIPVEGLSSEGGVDFPKGKKPEKLIQRCIAMSTSPGDWVLDSFLGSGTTAAVAHKMGRRWIGIELGDHCYTHCLPRLKAVVDGEQGGISKAVNWQGGGGFRFFELAPSLLKKDKYGNWIIDECYNADMLAAAMAKHQGFTYAPDSEVFWKQGYSFEKDYIFTTTQFVTLEYLDLIHQEMAGDESLLICCKAFQDGADQRYENINVKKIPQVLLNKCDFGVESYSLNIVGLPEIDEEVDDNE